MNPPVLLHRALEPAGGTPLGEVDLKDEDRLGVLLEAAAVLALLRRSGRQPGGGPAALAVDGDGHLRVGAPEPLGATGPPQRFLREVLQALFRTSGRVTGRGRVRKAAGRLLDRWAPSIVPFDPDRLVHDVFDEAPFLWDPRSGEARRRLVAEVDGGFWCAGPRGVELRLRGRAATADRARDLLAGPDARDLWENVDPERDDPDRLHREGRWARAALLYRRSAPDEPESMLRRARSLYGLGRYSAAIRVLRGQDDAESELIRVRCQIRLGRVDAARKTLGRLEDAGKLSQSQRVDRAEAAIRIHARRRNVDEVREWARRAVAETRGRHRLRARLLGAGAAWDLGDDERHDRILAETEEIRNDPEIGWRWYRHAALLALSRGDGQGVIDALRRILGPRRRTLSRELVGRLWSDLAIGRCLVDDLPGAERACRVALRLLSSCEGPGRESLVLANLAEVRIRRGRLDHAEETIRDALAADRRSGNAASLQGTWVLSVRLELARGRPLSALARLEEAREELATLGARLDHPLAAVLEARAHGWIGSAGRALELLRGASPEAFAELEPEERPAVWALAGDLEEALRAAGQTSWRALWSVVLAGGGVASRHWEDLDRLESFRRARLVADLEAVRPGICPPVRVRRAIERLRAEGADHLAENLRSRAARPWRALAAYLALDRPGPEDARELFAAAGFPEVRLVVRRSGREEVVLDGEGGETRLGVPVPGGRLELAAESADDVLRALLEAVRAGGSWDVAEEEGPAGEVAEDEETRPPLGEHPVFLAQLDRLDRLAVSELPILILGESGTGKELFARRAHAVSHRARGPFVAVNCAAFTGSLLMSELFGHVRGAFTGAERDRTGIFESGNGGTVFLDEVGELTPEAQAALLRVLEEGEIQRVGEEFRRRVDVRIVSATHRDLEGMVGEGSFRFDLLHRLKVVESRLPPLRDRGDDVLLLARRFLREAGRPETLADAVREKLLAHRWPGNVRELRNAIAVAVVLAGDGPLGAEHLDLPEARAVESPAAATYHGEVERKKRQLVREALRATGGNQAEAARRLDLSRQSLSYLVRRLGLDDEDFG